MSVSFARAGLFGAILCGAVPALSPMPAADAQSSRSADLLPPIGRFSEVYLENPKVSGNNLVGLRWLSQEHAFDPNSVHVVVANAQAIGRVCVEVVSKDGRYSSENVYDLSRSQTPAPGFKSPTSYKPELTAYATDDVSVIVRKAPCDTGQLTPIIPAFLSSSPTDRPSSSELRAFANADPARVSMTLVDRTGEPIATGRCSPAGSGVKIAYAAQCAIHVPITLGGEFWLRVSQKERFKTVQTDYPIVLP